jgi:hypothetical protein
VSFITFWFQNLNVTHTHTHIHVLTHSRTHIAWWFPKPTYIFSLQRKGETTVNNIWGVGNISLLGISRPPCLSASHTAQIKTEGQNSSRIPVICYTNISIQVVLYSKWGHRDVEFIIACYVRLFFLLPLYSARQETSQLSNFLLHKCNPCTPRMETVLFTRQKLFQILLRQITRARYEKL